MKITESNTAASVFLSLFTPYVIITVILLYFLKKYNKLSEMINDFAEKGIPVILSSITVFFAIATVLGANTSVLDLTVTSVLTFLISNNTIVATAYIVSVVFLLSLITAVKCVPLPKPVKTEDAKIAD